MKQTKSFTNIQSENGTGNVLYDKQMWKSVLYLLIIIIKVIFM